MPVTTYDFVYIASTREDANRSEFYLGLCSKDPKTALPRLNKYQSKDDPRTIDFSYKTPYGKHLKSLVVSRLKSYKIINGLYRIDFDMLKQCIETCGVEVNPLDE